MPEAKPIQVKIQLHSKQAQFRASRKIYRGFTGGRGVGKSFVGTYDLIRRALPGRLYGMYAPTYDMLEMATMDSFRRNGELLHAIKGYHGSSRVFTLYNDARVMCRSLDDPENARGPNQSGAYFDEASLVSHDAYKIVIACLREAGEQGWFSATFTPKGLMHWTYQVFGQGGPDTDLVIASTRENPFLPATFYDTLRQQYTSLYAQQELEGQFVQLSGGLMHREWFEIIPISPATSNAEHVRYWDLAATEPKKGRDPDYTAGTRIAYHKGLYIIEDMRHARESPHAIEQLVRQTAVLDGPYCTIGMEEEGGASGKSLTDHYKRNVLTGFPFLPQKPTGNKVARAMPLAAAAEAGLVKLVQGDWNKAFLDEVGTFPDSDHDDAIDATASAFEMLAARHRAFSPAGNYNLTSPLIREYDSALKTLKAEMTPDELIELDKLEREADGK